MSNENHSISNGTREKNKENIPQVGRFLGGIGALIFNPEDKTYLLLKRAQTKDFAPGVWECVTGRVDQGEGFEEAVVREVREEIGVQVTPVYILGTTHFYRGTAVPENELIGVIYLCTIPDPSAVVISKEHDEFCWLTGSQALVTLTDKDPTTSWTRNIIQQAESIWPHLPVSLIALNKKQGFAFG